MGKLHDFSPIIRFQRTWFHVYHILESDRTIYVYVRDSIYRIIYVKVVLLFRRWTMYFVSSLSRIVESFYLLLLLLLAFSDHDCSTIILFHVFCIHVAIVGQIARYSAIVYFNCIYTFIQRMMEYFMCFWYIGAIYRTILFWLNWSIKMIVVQIIYLYTM